MKRATTIPELAEAWHCSEGHIRNLIERGELRSVLIGRSRRILEDDADAYLASRAA